MDALYFRKLAMLRHRIIINNELQYELKKRKLEYSDLLSN